MTRVLIATNDAKCYNVYMDKGTKTLIAQLKAYRLKHQLTQEQLARELKVNRLTLYRWFNSENAPRELERYRIKELLRKK